MSIQIRDLDAMSRHVANCKYEFQAYFNSAWMDEETEDLVAGVECAFEALEKHIDWMIANRDDPDR